jgi:Fe2+ transport system protein B
MSKSDAIVLVEATEIMESLPSAMRHDDQIMDSVIESLQAGVSKLSARQDALEIAQLKLQETVAHGFNLVNTEIQGIKHEAEKDRIHATYAQKAAEQAKSIAEQAWQKTQELAIGVVKAEAKADGARDLAKQSNRFQFDPLTGMTVCTIAIVGAFCLIAFGTSRSQPVPSGRNLDLLTCGVEVTCIPNQPRQPIPTNNRGGV